MADTVAITAGSGTTIGTDQVSIGGTTQHLQRVKVYDATDGSTNPMLVTSRNAVAVEGPTASDAAAAAAPVLVGVRARASLEAITHVTTNDVVYLHGDTDGGLVVRTAIPLGDVTSQRVADTGGTSTALTTGFPATASTRNYVTNVVVYNNAATAAYVDLRDGTGGSVLATIGAPTKQPSTVLFNPPLRQPTANTTLAYDVSAALGGTVYVTVVGFQSKS